MRVRLILRTQEMEAYRMNQDFKQKQIEKIKCFRDLHKKTLILPNAWNGGSAKVFESEGFQAIGTTSAGIAYSKGLADGEHITFESLKEVVKEILHVTEIPLTVDMERGYGKTLDGIVGNVRTIIELGAVGINIEDGIPEEKRVDDVEDFATKIRAVSALKEELDLPFFINGRTDVFLMQTGSLEEMIEETVKRASLLKDAGADGLFVPGPLSKETIELLRERISLPLNVYLHKAYYDIDELRNMGISRVSTGSAPVRTLFKTLISHSQSLGQNQVDDLLNHDFDYGTANRYFSG